MKLRRISTLGLFVMFGVVLTLSAVYGQRGTDTAKDPVAEADEKIIAEIHDHNEIMTNMEYLSDMIGARLTGTENLKKANDWTRQKFADYGVANPQLEPWTVAHTWTRVSATAQIVSPAVHTLTIASYAWAPSTNGMVRGRVVYVKARTMDDLTQYKGKLKDAIVISAEPNLLPAPDQPAPNPVDVPYGDSFLLLAPRPPSAEPVYGPDFRKFLQARTAFFKNEGVLATLTDSGKPDGLLNMTGMGGRKLRAFFRRRARFGWFAGLCCRAQRRIAKNIGCANPRYRHGTGGEHQPDAKLSGPRDDGQSCGAAAFARLAGIDSAVDGRKRSQFF